MKNVEIVGEAAYMLTKEFKASHPEIPWKQVEGMCHVLVHGYLNIQIGLPLLDDPFSDGALLAVVVHTYFI